jgi:hypothetical protein
MRCLKPGPECFYSRWRSPVVDRTHADQDTAVPKSYYGGSGYYSVPPLYYPEPNGYPGSGGYYNGSSIILSRTQWVSWAGWAILRSKLDLKPLEIPRRYNTY